MNKDDSSIKDALPKFQEYIKYNINKLKEINLRMEDDKCPIFISSLLNEAESKNLIRLLFEFKNCFS